MTKQDSRDQAIKRCRDAAVAPDGRAISGRDYTIPARGGVAVLLQRGSTISIVNPSGHQVCDFWAFAAGDVTEYLSMAHLHTSISSIFPKAGDTLVTSLRRGLLTIVEDTSDGVHDTVIASCDPARYRQLGCEDYHDNCADNLYFAMEAIGLTPPIVPAPFNIWMNVPLAADGGTHFAAPTSKAGDRITLRAEADAIVVMSACPQDMTPVNGEGTVPDILIFRVTDAD